MKIADATALITGGASGLGAATVRHLARLGARVVIADLNREAGEALARELGEAAAFASTDVTSEASTRAAIELARSRFGGPHILVNCAGVGLAERTISRDGPHSLERFVRVIQVNLVGTFNALRLAAWAMAQNEPNEEGERGVIINTASVAAFEGQIGQVAYAASKGGVVSLTLPAARDLARNGIRVVTIAPGIFDTPMLGQLPAEIRNALAQQMLFPQRLGRPEEYARLVQHIIENPMLNGEVIRLDGGLRMPPR